ncbi:MAG: hypothetical protein HY042_02935 [Spirochaetia bacterium]|nr:hypothetical protein [Spirochaetia bacterium]
MGRQIAGRLTWACLISLAMASCGVNTDQPVFPLYTTFTVVGPPAIISVTPVEVGIATSEPTKPYGVEFNVNFYVTNQEDGFLGYNLYISTSSTSAQSTLGGFTSGPYLPNGVAPSFPEAGKPASTASTALVTQRIQYQKPPPGEIQIQLCEKYFFRMTALVRNNIESAASTELPACAAANTALCPKGGPCNP